MAAKCFSTLINFLSLQEVLWQNTSIWPIYTTTSQHIRTHSYTRHRIHSVCGVHSISYFIATRTFRLPDIDKNRMRTADCWCIYTLYWTYNKASAGSHGVRTQSDISTGACAVKLFCNNYHSLDWSSMRACWEH